MENHVHINVIVKIMHNVNRQMENVFVLLALLAINVSCHAQMVLMVKNVLKGANVRMVPNVVPKLAR
jgi:hypothetical protein